MARCNVLHCTSSGGPFWSLQPQLLTVHDLIPALFDDGLSEGAKSLFLRRLKNGLRNAKGIITVSAHTKSDLLQLFPQLPSPVKVIHWGCDHSVRNSSTAAPPSNSPYIMAFGGKRRERTRFTRLNVSLRLQA